MLTLMRLCALINLLQALSAHRVGYLEDQSSIFRIGYPTFGSYKSSFDTSRILDLYTVRHLPNFAGLEVRFRNPARARYAPPPRHLVLPPTRSIAITPPPTEVRGRSQKFWLYDVGFRQLERDTARLVSLALAEQRSAEPGEFTIASSPERQRALMNLNRFRATVHEAVLERYRADPEISAKLGNRSNAPFTAWDATYSNYDVLAVFDRPIGRDAGADEIRRHLIVTLQISY